MRNYKSFCLIVSTFILGSPVAGALSLKLNPKGSQVFENTYHMTVNAVCTLQCRDVNKIKVSIMNSRGRVNGKTLTSGQATSLSVHDHQSITVTAEPGAKVSLLNLGNFPIQASCS